MDLTPYLAPVPPENTWRFATHGVGSKHDGGIYTMDLDRRFLFRTREQRRQWLNPQNRKGASKYAFGGFVPVFFGDTNERKNVNVRGSDGWVVLDFDGLQLECLDAMSALNALKGEWFTTYSHGVKDGLRIRVVLELDRGLAYDKATGVDEVTPARAAASYLVVEMLGLDPEPLVVSRVIDKLCWRPSQYFNVPCHDPARPQDCLFRELNGAHVLSADRLIERGRQMVTASAPVFHLGRGDFPDVTLGDRAIAEEDLVDVCKLFEAHRGPGFGNYYTHGKRLGGRVAMGQLSYEEAWDCLTLSIEEGLAIEAEENDTEMDLALKQRREDYLESWLDDPYTHAGLVASRLFVPVTK